MSEPSIAVKDIEELLGLAPSGDSRAFLSLASIENAGPNDIVFAQDEKTLTEALKSAAGLILAPVKVDSRNDKRVLQVKNPKYAFAQCGKWFDGFLKPVIHPAAIVDA